MAQVIIAIPVCPKHPRYEGKRATERDCIICQVVYLSRQVQVLQHHVQHLVKRERESWQVYY